MKQKPTAEDILGEKVYSIEAVALAIGGEDVKTCERNAFGMPTSLKASSRIMLNFFLSVVSQTGVEGEMAEKYGSIPSIARKVNTPFGMNSNLLEFPIDAYVLAYQRVKCKSVVFSKDDLVYRVKYHALTLIFLLFGLFLLMLNVAIPLGNYGFLAVVMCAVFAMTCRYWEWKRCDTNADNELNKKLEEMSRLQTPAESIREAFLIKFSEEEIEKDPFLKQLQKRVGYERINPKPMVSEKSAEVVELEKKCREYKETINEQKKELDARGRAKTAPYMVLFSVMSLLDFRGKYRHIDMFTPKEMFEDVVDELTTAIGDNKRLENTYGLSKETVAKEIAKAVTYAKKKQISGEDFKKATDNLMFKWNIIVGK